MRAILPFRLIVSLYGLLLAVASLWILLAELPRPGVAVLPTTPQLAITAARDRRDALWVARFAVLRGDLWAESAFTFADLQWTDVAEAQQQVLEQAKASATRALSLMPSNSAVWQLLADLASRYGWQRPRAIEALKMAYYTGPHNDSLVPLRLSMSARFNVAADPELDRLFRGEVENILTYRPALRPAVVAAYGSATPQARQAIEDAAIRIDPAFARTLPAANVR